MARPDLPLQPQPQPQSSLPEAQPKASKALPIAALIVRVITKISLLVSLTVLTSNSATLKNEYGEVKFRFRQVYAYRYVVSVVVIGMTYTFLQIPFSINRVTTAKRLPDNDGLLNFDFIGDKIMK
ncbi:hypothetical protein RJ639_001238 [Escallonia herrerae]|uniref:CASP-like protein n=1 Tax=Escallonia herrerae TaxID=1293975 RepID=A0AA88XNE6_9ASTE|nr:hypothetical protein RJ639_001238 [Escallonia herrerae]